MLINTISMTFNLKKKKKKKKYAHPRDSLNM